EQRPKTEVEVQSFLKESLNILEIIQHHGITHQNLHPNNLIRHRDRGHLVLVDFGLIQDTSAPEPNIVVSNGGSIIPSAESAYLPQINHRQYIRFAPDHFALGIIAVQMATGLSNEAIPRFSQSNFLTQIKLQLDECSSLSDAFKDILLKMVSPQAEEQFHQAKDILAAINNLPSAGLTPAAASDPAVPPATEAAVPVDSVQPTSARTSALARAQVLRRPGFWLAAGVALALLALGALVLLRNPKGREVSELMAQAETAAQMGQKNEAMNYLDQALAIEPNNSEALAERSALLWENGQPEQALQDLTDAIEAKPKSAVLYYQRGNLRLRLGDLQGAIADYGEALQQQETYTDAYVNRGNARAELGDEAGAVQDYTAAINLASSPESKADAYLNRCLSLSNLDDHGAALSDCTEAINLRPNNSLAYENRGLVKRRLGDFQGGIQDFTIAIQINSSNPEPYYNRALARQDLGDLAGAMSDFDQTINLNSSHPFAYYDRGLLHAELGNLDLAIADLETVASACLDVSRVGCFDDAQYQLEKLRAERDSP
ncbi:MAG: tetratricopeptide repeat protein, partial [Nodosilinea sp.]